MTIAGVNTWVPVIYTGVFVTALTLSIFIKEVFLTEGALSVDTGYLVHKGTDCWLTEASDLSYSFGRIHLGQKMSLPSEGWTVIKTVPGESVYKVMYDETDLEPWMCGEF